ncbi:TetR/AcrR family transcriptional regulator [Tetragenococcus halophilus]|uniref:TetR/AcrR family transcriptional regulator n=2 Tax=Tetragenococcus halophilus TaxID=51669 RepID=A0AB35HL99_TETHA|nr:TetR/AcrR family transcriptional regulator [Tetragenococcus halophilus]AOF48361.1 TetR family transcriptional regulator [Tetragenococcus halophilus]MCF1685147.1 TetR/AcrR family transcriptional regulator [Tetragenococcus halophilus]MCO8284425.1 TetR/AcrR family transcriptional regulator [Tetragenococcus halophilus]MCO8293556.1 TetR/AcrR family transcriptional regulator [Tetragenococcus halophilus]MCO8297069.1 TetR/AcrR family transcriptional regulator [Tetragenococcus halophilus]
MESSLDLRVQKTYDALITALLDLLKEKSLDKITVNELCQKARIRRPTFYKHFNDKYDFFNFTAQSLQEHYIAKVEEKTDDTHPVRYFITLFQTMLDAIDEYQKVLLPLKIDGTSFSIFETVDDKLKQQLEKRLRHFYDMGYQLPTNVDFSLQVLLGAFKQAAFWWLKNQETLSKKEVIDEMNKTLRWFFDMQR